MNWWFVVSEINRVAVSCFSHVRTVCPAKYRQKKKERKINLLSSSSAFSVGLPWAFFLFTRFLLSLVHAFSWGAAKGTTGYTT